MFCSFQLVLSVKISCVMWSLFLNYSSSFTHIMLMLFINSTYSVRQAEKKAEQVRKQYLFSLARGISSPTISIKCRWRIWGDLYWHDVDIKVSTVTCNDLFLCLTTVKANIVGYHVLMLCLIPFLIICFII